MLDKIMLLAGSAALFCCALAMPALSATTNAPNTFEFTGACTDCYGGRGNGTGTLVLTPDYQPGQDIKASNFISFTYNGTDLQPAFTVTDTSQITLSGSMTGPFPDTETFSLFGPNTLAFISDKNGYWCVGFSCTADYGSNHLWSQLIAQVAVPEPASWALVVGFGLVGAAVRRGRTASGAASA